MCMLIRVLPCPGRENDLGHGPRPGPGPFSNADGVESGPGQAVDGT